MTAERKGRCNQIGTR